MIDLKMARATDQSFAGQNNKTSQLYQENKETASLLLWFMHALQAKLMLLETEKYEGRICMHSDHGIQLFCYLPEIAEALGIAPKCENFSEGFNKLSFQFLGIEVYQLVETEVIR